MSEANILSHYFSPGIWHFFLHDYVTVDEKWVKILGLDKLKSYLVSLKSYVANKWAKIYPAPR